MMTIYRFFSNDEEEGDENDEDEDDEDEMMGTMGILIILVIKRYVISRTKEYRVTQQESTETIPTNQVKTDTKT